MKKITFKRPNENFNQSISYKIFMENNVLIELKNGDEATVEIPTRFENKSIRAVIQKWWGSEKVELNSLSENETLIVKGNKFLNKKAIFIIVLLPLTGALIFGFGSDNLLIKNIGIGLFF